MNLKGKIYLYDNSTTQRCPTEIMKTFLIKDFFCLPPVSKTPMVHLELQISLGIFKNIPNGPNGIINCDRGFADFEAHFGASPSKRLEKIKTYHALELK
jgi:hypothetical protein